MNILYKIFAISVCLGLLLWLISGNIIFGLGFGSFMFVCISVVTGPIIAEINKRKNKG